MLVAFVVKPLTYSPKYFQSVTQLELAGAKNVKLYTNDHISGLESWSTHFLDSEAYNGMVNRGEIMEIAEDVYTDPDSRIGYGLDLEDLSCEDYVYIVVPSMERWSEITGKPFDWADIFEIQLVFNDMAEFDCIETGVEADGVAYVKFDGSIDYWM